MASKSFFLTLLSDNNIEHPLSKGEKMNLAAMQK